MTFYFPTKPKLGRVAIDRTQAFHLHLRPIVGAQWVQPIKHCFPDYGAVLRHLDQRSVWLQ